MSKEKEREREREGGRKGERERNAARSEFNYDIISSSSLNGFLLQQSERREEEAVCAFVFVCVKRTTCVAGERRV